MQITQIAPLTEAIPPKLYGGTERVISWLADELVALGHDVVLFASGDSQTSANLEACWPKALRLDGSVFAFLGRISLEKAVDQAIWIAKRCGVPLKIAAKVDAVDRDYFETEIRKLLTPLTSSISARSATAKSRAFSAAPSRCWRPSPGPSRSA
jgi:hypothetical protein